MTTNIALICIIAACVVILAISLLKKKTEILLNFVMRVVIGSIGIYFINEFLLTKDIGVSVGINPMTLFTVGSLGISGLALLYGILFYKFL